MVVWSFLLAHITQAVRNNLLNTVDIYADFVFLVVFLDK